MSDWPAEVLREAEKTGALVHTIFRECVDAVEGKVDSESARIAAIGGIVGGLRVVLNDIEKEMDPAHVAHLRDEIILKLYPPSIKNQN